MADPALNDNLDAIVEQLHEIGARNVLILHRNRNGSQTVILTAVFADYDQEDAHNLAHPHDSGPGHHTAQNHPMG